MVKNKTGGKNAKKSARKNVNESIQPRKLRFIDEQGEHYAIITKIVGATSKLIEENTNYTIDVKSILQQVTPSTKIIYLANPTLMASLKKGLLGQSNRLMMKMISSFLIL